MLCGLPDSEAWPEAIVFDLDGKIVFELPGDVVLDAIPEELIATPTLVWTLEADGAGEHDPDQDVAHLADRVVGQQPFQVVLHQRHHHRADDRDRAVDRVRVPFH